MRIDASDHAREFIAERGGKLYVWVDDHDFGHAKPEPPDKGIDWVEYPEDGFTLYQDASIEAPDWWRLEFHHLPHPHVTATWDGGRFGEQGLGPDNEPGEL